MSNYEVALDAGFGSRPHLPARRGSLAVAAKRSLWTGAMDDESVRRVPSNEAIAAVTERQIATAAPLRVRLHRPPKRTGRAWSGPVLA